MTVTSPRSVRADQVRATAVVVLAVAQAVVGGLTASGPTAATIAEVASANRTPLLPASWVFAVWGPIYLGFLAYAGYQCFPRQRPRELHRRTGWWLAFSALCNMGWIASWTSDLLPLAELLLIGLLVALAVVYGRLSREPATSAAERFAVRGPVALYTGWVSIVIVLGTAATGVWIGLPGHNAIAGVAAIIVLLPVAAILAWVVLNGTAVVGYVLGALWGLAGVALGDTPAPVSFVAGLAFLAVVATTALRLSSAASFMRAAFG